MSDAAKALLHYAEGSRYGGSDGASDAAYCRACARKWAAYIIAGGV